MTAVLDTAALAVTAAGLLALLAAPVHGWYPALRLALEFWIGAGLLRLSSSPSWSALAVAAAIISVRVMVQLGWAPASTAARHR
ncbi:MAG TPA: DUF1622 domain-containing protein [Myxococcaceae bacterium]|nr:DUF1622 domain-containing protein [Myxococcaceae bacterium]